MRISFSTHLTILFSGITALALTATTVFSWHSASSTETRNARETLQVSQRVFEELLADSNEQLSLRAQVLAEDFGFRESMATGEQDTIISTLANHGARVDADMMFLLTPAGEIQASTHELGDLKARQKLIRGSLSKLIYSEGGIYQVAVVPVRAPDLVGWVGMGAIIDSELIRHLKELTQTEVTLLIRTADNGTSVMSTLPFVRPGDFTQTTPEVAGDVLMADMTGRGLLGHTFPIDELSDARLSVILSNSLEQHLQAWQGWHQQLWLIGFAALLMTALTAYAVSALVTRPVRRLVAAAREIADGNYKPQINVTGAGEFGILANTMTTMGNAVNEREQKILFQARHDETTGLPNLRYLSEIVEQTLTNTDRESCVMLIQLDNFQRLNEVYGVDWCDHLMQLIARKLSSALEGEEMAARVGGGQFLLFCPSPDGCANDSGSESTSVPANTRSMTRKHHYSATEIARRITNILCAPYVCDGIEVDISVKLGTSLSPTHGTQLLELMRRASIALSRSQPGFEGVAYYEDGEDLKVLRQLRVTQRLQLALNGEGLELHFQPKYDFHKQRVSQVEALLRWHDAELGRVFPDEFIPLAESSGDILELSDWVTRTAARHAAQWRQQGLDVQIAINVSGRDFLQSDFVEKTRAMIAAEGAHPEQFIIEVTESAMIENLDQAINHLHQLRASGFTLAIDDFGTGFSSLAQLKRLPVHELKIDKAFILELDGDIADQKIVRSTIALGQSLDMKVVAEGLENFASLELLRQMGCDAIQGYHLARPMDREHFERWWANHDENVARALNAPKLVSQDVASS